MGTDAQWQVGGRHLTNKGYESADVPFHKGSASRRLTAGEYQRGVVSWNVSAPTTIRTGIADSLSSPPAWSPQFGNAAASVPRQPPPA
jgi:hypothetical protein